MPIQFRCHECLKELRVGDDAAGKSAKCPACGTVQAVPAATEPSTSDAPSAAEPAPSAESDSPFLAHPEANTAASLAADFPPESDNPYQSPAEYVPEAPRPRFVTQSGPLVPTKIGVGDVFRVSWALFNENVTPCLAGGAIVAVFWLGSYFAQMAFAVGMTFQGVANVNMLIMTFWVLALVRGLVVLWLGLGFGLLLLPAARGEEVPIRRFFVGRRRYLRNLFASLLVGVTIGALYILCVTLLHWLLTEIGLPNNLVAIFLLLGANLLVSLPIGYLALNFIWYGAFILDRDARLMESIRWSTRIMRGNQLAAFGIGCLVFIPGVLFAMFTCYLGLALVVPYWACVYVTIYMLASGQPMAVAGAVPVEETLADGPSPQEPSPETPTDELDPR